MRSFKEVIEVNTSGTSVRRLLYADCDQAIETFDHDAISVCKEFDAKHMRLSADPGNQAVAPR